MTNFKRKLLVIAASAGTLALGIGAFSFACGPDFPDVYLSKGSADLLAAPEGMFAEEIALIAPPDRKVDWVEGGPSSEADELRQVLEKTDMPEARRQSLIQEYKDARDKMLRNEYDKVTLSDDLPAEFALYLKGALAYWKNDYEQAREHWKAVLALPEKERHYRTVAASYMLGHTYVPNGGDGLPTRNQIPEGKQDDMAKGAEWLRKAREYGAAGFADLSSLADASCGWEARAHFLRGDYPPAVALYLQQYALGDKRSAVWSLRAVARAALADAQAGENSQKSLSWVKDELTRRVVTAYLLARLGTNPWDSDGDRLVASQSKQWAAILEKAELGKVRDADRLAWLAYQAGFFDLSKQWADLAPEDATAAQWIRAKLALRTGDAINAEKLLTQATGSTSVAGNRAVAWADLGRVRMGRSEYVSALDAFVRGGHAEDAAYVAERVLTLAELTAYVEQYGSDSAKIGNGEKYQQALSNNFLRHLLARRLARSNMPEAATPYFPEEVRKHYTDYIADVRQGFDLSGTAEKRAEAFWRAARNVREHGMEMLGTELEPDFFIWGGNFSYGGVSEARFSSVRLEGGPGAPTGEEMRRVKLHTVPASRFHYRYRAADLGWWAASLMPNDSEETAKVLNEAGAWLKNRDPQAANRFYQGLIIRCGKTETGKAAAAKNWFNEKSVSDGEKAPSGQAKEESCGC